MIEMAMAVIGMVATYLIGRAHATQAITDEETRILKELRDEVIALRKWKADNIGKETA